MITNHMLLNIGHMEIIAIIAVIVLLFGSTQIPKVARAIGQSLKEFKKGKAEGEDQENSNK